MNNISHFDVIVIGAGPAGLAAGIYLSRAKLKTLILNRGTVGGQLILTHEIANYPGVESASGYTLASIMKKQALSFGSVIKSVSIDPVIEDHGNLKKVVIGETEYTAHAIILAPGGSPRMLDVPGEKEFKGYGISYCATCDGEFFNGKEIVVIGGGNSALEEAVSLSKYATKITIVHQFDHFQAFPTYVEVARENARINFVMNAEVVEFSGAEKLEKVLIHYKSDDHEEWFSTDGAFIFIGYQANTGFLKNVVDLNAYGEIIVNTDMETSIPGIFAAGDSIAKKYRQVTTAVGEATVAALAAASKVYEFKRKIK